MNSTRYGLLATITAFSACGALLTPIVATAQDEQVSEETEVLTRGPVHEAFAEAVSFEPEPGILISTQPPEVIDELPPEQELEGDNVTWIPGYWAWDEDSSDFLWISGIWRNIPPDREWVPGYWNEVGSEYQWVSGYWSDTGTEEVTYLPAPPRSLEAGPNVAAESDNDVWIPGTWMWADTRYRWRPGYYQPYRDDWTYVPDRYSWTPRGYVYVNGYWDYTVPRRGVIFAPVRFHHHVYRRPNFYYSPVTVISLNLFVDHLFVRPRYNHYYFGDYYEPSYRDRGFIYNVSYARMRGGYDPIFAHRRWEHRHDRDWERNRMADFDFFRDNRDARPPRSWANLRDIGDGRRGFKGRDGKDFALATPLAQFVKNPGADAGDAGGKGRGRMNFKKLDGGAREKIVNQRKQMVDFTKQRKQMEKEAPVGKAVEGEAAPKPVKAKLNRSPIMGRKAAQMGDQAPPKRKQAPAVADKDPVADGTPQPGDNKPGQPGRPGRGGQGGGKGKGGAAGDDTTTTPDQPGRPGRGGQGGGKGKGGNAGDDTTTTPDQPGRPGRGGQGGGGKGKQGQMTDDNKPAPAPKEETTPAPKREPKPQPEKVQPPKRQPQPERQVQPKKQPQPQPERQVQPKKQPQPQPERQVQPKKQPQPQPERQVQPKKQAQPQRQQPQREAQPQRAQPKREAQPQRQQPQRQPQRPQGGGGEGGGGKGKNKEKDN